MFSAVPASAHPHNWIELKTTFVLDSQFRLSEIKQIWKFDIFYSMITLADIMSEYKDEQTGLDAAARAMITDLEEYNYFSFLKVKNTSIPLSEPYSFRLYKASDDPSANLEMEIKFALSPAVSIDNVQTEWQTFDPTYYIAMLHPDTQSIEITGNQNINCSVTIEDPNPSEEIINYALSLDQTQRQTNGLGKHFAEKVRINCHSIY